MARGVRVAPFAGAWIEIPISETRALWNASSLPSRERGLKFKNYNTVMERLESLPSRERGLKC